MTRGSGTDLKKYYPNGMAAWTPESMTATGLANALNGTSLARPEIEFTLAAHSEGIEIEGEAIGDGRIHRVPHRDSKRGEKDGWYVLFTDGEIAGGAYGCWKGLEFTTTWRAEIGRNLTFQEQQDHKRQLDTAREHARAEREVHRQEAAVRAANDVASWIDATDQHPYLQAKKIKAHKGLKTDGAGKLIIPYETIDGLIQTYQSIGPAPDFQKRFLKDGAKKGSFFEIRGSRSQIYIAEGYATAATVAAATGATVICAGDAGSLTGVAQIQHEAYPSAQIFIAGDNDAFTLVAGVAQNVGLIKGQEAAKAVGGVLVYPVFTEADLMAHPKGAPTDWNDLATLRGLEEVRTQLAATTQAHTRRAEFSWVRGDQLEIKPIDWLIKGYIEENSLAQLFGESGCGKSFVILDIALCIATGKAWLGHSVQQGSVFYICGEGHSGISRRLRAWEAGNGVDICGYPFFKSVGAAQLCEAITINRNGAAQVAESIRKMVEITGVIPKIVFVDTLSRNYGGDENSTEEMAAFIQHLDEYIRRPWGCCVMLAHHTGAQDKDRSRGSTALRGALDAEYKVSRDPVTGVITVEPKKMKDADLPTAVMLKLQRIALTGRDGTPVLDDEGVAEMGAYLVDCTADVGKLVTGINQAVAAQEKAFGKNQKIAIKEIDAALNDYAKAKESEQKAPPFTVEDWKALTKVVSTERGPVIKSLQARKKIEVSPGGVITLCNPATVAAPDSAGDGNV